MAGRDPQPHVGTGPAADARGEVLVILWFDAEDYLLPASDDAAKRVAEILTARGVRGTFEIVGEKARVLERRGRTDVIAALKRHDIGYHSNLHSVHPTPAEYLADTGWTDGVEEFARREGGGAADVGRVFGVPSLSCYGQPGSVMGAAGVRRPPADRCCPRPPACRRTVDEGTHAGIGEQPFWYHGVLTVYNMGRNATRMDLFAPGGLETGRADFETIYRRIRANGGGLMQHLLPPGRMGPPRVLGRGELRTRRESAPRGLESAAAATARGDRGSLERFAAYIDFQRSLPGVRHVTASDLAAIYHDRIRESGLDRAAVRDVATRLAPALALDVMPDDAGRALSPADQFAVMTRVLALAIERGTTSAHVDVPALLGPVETAPPGHDLDLPWPAFRDAVLETDQEMRVRGHVPARIFVGATPLAPADFLRAAAAVVAGMLQSDASQTPMFPARVAVPGGTAVATERFIAKDSPELFGGWVIHPPGFRAPRVMELARLQAWTLKPAEH